jgi:RHS repeat-associated protein
MTKYPARCQTDPVSLVLRIRPERCNGTRAEIPLPECFFRSYDFKGNMTNNASNTRARDAFCASRMGLRDAFCAPRTTFLDAEGRRVQKTTPSNGTVQYAYDLAGHVVAELNSSGGWNRGEVFAGGRHVATYSGATYFNITDWLGTERVRTDMYGNKCETITSQPFGDAQTTSGSCGDPSPLHFTGKQRDPETGLDDFDARYYSSSFGRFMSNDWSSVPAPVPYAEFTDPQSLNLYVYVRNNPIGRTDPDGHCCDLGDAFDYGAGILRGVASSLSFGAMGAPTADDSLASRAGQATGTTLTGIAGEITADAGKGAMAVGALAEVPSAGTSTAVVAAGAGAAAIGTTAEAGAAANLARLATTTMQSSAIGPKEGESSGPGAGKDFNASTKAEAVQQNQTANGGQAKCVFCGEPVGQGTGNKTNIDHAQAKANGGTNGLNNANVTCQYCNQSKGMGTTPKNPKVCATGQPCSQ